MSLIFSKHAMGRIVEREISLREIANCYAIPDKIIDEENEIVFMKLDKIDQKLLIFVCAKEGQNHKIITVIKTGKVKKYL